MPFLRRWRKRHPDPLPSRQAYQKWAGSYPPHAHNDFMVLEEKTLSDMMPNDLNGLSILDLACGTGRWGRIAAERGAKQIISADDSGAMLGAGRPPLAFQSSMTALGLRANCADGLICGLAIGHVVTARMWASLAEMKRVLKPNGWALISDVHPFQMWGGGRRSFRAESKVYAVEHYIHSYADYHAAAQQLGLIIEAVQEVGLASEKPPLLLAIRLRKPSA